jgi:hypothetical protein
MGAELGRKRAGLPTRTGMSVPQLEEFAMGKKGKGMKSHMPKGATQSPSGDIGLHRQNEADTQKGFKDKGPVLKVAGRFSGIGK